MLTNEELKNLAVNLADLYFKEKFLDEKPEDFEDNEYFNPHIKRDGAARRFVHYFLNHLEVYGFGGCRLCCN